MKRYHIILRYPQKESVWWVNSEGRQVVSNTNCPFWVTEKEKDILKADLPNALEILEECED